MERLSFDSPQRKATHSKSSNISFAMLFTARIFPWHKVFLVIKFGITFLEKMINFNLYSCGSDFNHFKLFFGP